MSSHRGKGHKKGDGRGKRSKDVDVSALTERQRRYLVERDRANVVRSRVEELSAELEEKRQASSHPGDFHPP